MPRARTMLLLLSLLAAAAAAPRTYDQRQDGELNIQADLQNIVVLVAMPSKVPSLFDMFTRNNQPIKDPEVQDRADIQVMEAFVEPNTPYHVDIGSERSADVDGRAVEVVIAARRRADADSPQAEQDEYKLLGATEQCGPDRVRDPVTLICKFMTEEKKQESSADKKAEKTELSSEEKKKEEVKVESQPTPEVIPS